MLLPTRHPADTRRINAVLYTQNAVKLGLVQQHTTREVVSALRVSGTARKFRPDIPKITSASLACRATITRPSLSSAPQTDSPPPRILLLFTSALFCFAFPRLPFSLGRLFRCIRRHARRRSPHGCLSVRASRAAYEHERRIEGEREWPAKYLPWPPRSTCRKRYRWVRAACWPSRKP